MKRRVLIQKLFVILFTLTLLFGVFHSEALSYSGSGILRIHYIDVGQADSILIQSGNSNMLIDAGNRSDDKTVIAYLNRQGVKKLDVVIGTHPHEDHIGAMGAILTAYKTDKIIMPKITSNTKTFKELLLTIKSKGMKITTPIPGSSFKLGVASCTILAPNSSSYEDINNYSVVVKIVYGTTSFMFDGDAEDLAEKQMIDKGYNLHADVLKIGHHGSRTASSDIFLNKVQPKYAIISCGKNNDYGHPHKETIDKLLSRNIKVYRTDLNGTIVCTSNGTKISFTTSVLTKDDNSNTISSGEGTKPLTPEASANNGKQQNKNPIVYVSKSGSKYHLINCSALKTGKIQILLNDAKIKGYSPCKICNPPR